MIIKLSEEIEKEILSGNLDEIILAALDNIAIMLINGSNLFYCNLSTINHILLNLQVRSRTKEIFKKYKSTLRQIQGFENKLCFKCIICNGQSEVRFEKGTPSLLLVPIEYVADNKYLLSPKLIFEDYYDIDFITELCTLFIRSTKNIFIPIKYKGISGNGSRTGEALLRNAGDDDSFIYCLVDTDKKSPSDSFGETYNLVMFADAKLKASNTFNYYINTLDFHEVENILPNYFIHKIYGDDICYQERINHLNMILTLNSLYRKYFDYKKGIQVGLLRKERCNSDNFWTTAVKHLGLFEQHEHLLSDDKNDKYNIVFGFNDYLKKSLDCLKNSFTEVKDEIVFDSDILKVWINISDDIFSICCASNRIRC